ncbi:MAG: hypothetical protein WCF30_18245 [Terracidiphilus sp.]
MKSSLIPTGTSDATLRLVLPAILACSLAIGSGPQAARAQQAPQSSLLGEWRATIQSGTVTISFLSTGQYDQTGVTTTGVQTMQAGPYQLVAPNNIIFTVTNWSPKTRIVLVPCGIPNDPVCNVQRVVNMPKPPGSEYAYVFNGPNAMTLTNQTGAINFTRVKGQ